MSQPLSIHAYLPSHGDAYMERRKQANEDRNRVLKNGWSNLFGKGARRRKEEKQQRQAEKNRQQVEQARRRAAKELWKDNEKTHKIYLKLGGLWNEACDKLSNICHDEWQEELEEESTRMEALIDDTDKYLTVLKSGEMQERYDRVEEFLGRVRALERRVDEKNEKRVQLYKETERQLLNVRDLVMEIHHGHHDEPLWEFRSIYLSFCDRLEELDEAGAANKLTSKQFDDTLQVLVNDVDQFVRKVDLQTRIMRMFALRDKIDQDPAVRKLIQRDHHDLTDLLGYLRRNIESVTAEQMQEFMDRLETLEAKAELANT